MRHSCRLIVSDIAACEHRIMRAIVLLCACLVAPVGCDDADDDGPGDAAFVDASVGRGDAASVETSREDASVAFDATPDAAPACALVAGLCTPGCYPAIGSTIDPSTCKSTEATLVCVRSPIANQANSCVVEVASGTVYWLSVDYGFQYGSAAWRPCTNAENAAFSAAAEACRRKDGGLSHGH